ncbi:CtsR family transcriptional regulator [Ammoniphilus sp. CFH 90114]|uniref:CtsR family transcriptional regulator n=1 Tax=Ammoniphilus sp. CFH 90114 TaxID=2493665 RepID=UPI00100F7CC7|nr:CtsR family transcriptional regulator [Ammoniphilus sp. CFH 90114]RXT09043.1 CtsR family transcriptional regulator [Ammoniphilus sp. CFH 90114]
MRNISDIIEQHLKSILQQSRSGIVEIQRSELADQFQCVPSQINYVISTRFSMEKGYIVESKRGGGGYIRIRKVEITGSRNLYELLMDMVGNSMSQSTAENILIRLEEEGFITPREGQIMKAAISRDVLTFDLQIRDQLRAAIIRAMITQIFMHNGGESS